MIVAEVIKHLEELSPLNYAEDFDNVGLLVGDQNSQITGILVTLDTLETVVEEAIDNNCNLIVSFHPIIFKGLKKLTGRSYVERAVIKAIKHDIAIYSMHTALDNAWHGVNDAISDHLGLVNKKILIPQEHTIKKLTTFVPLEHTESVRNALFNAGAGNIGNYSDCSFNIEGTGTYMGNEDSNPTIGKKGHLHKASETCITMIFEKHLESQILNALIKHHPYEEVAYEVHTLDNNNQHIGMGMIGELSKEMSEIEFLELVKSKMKTGCIRHSGLLGQSIKKVAVLGGSGAFAISAAIRSGAEIFVTSDLKYHDFFSAEGKIVLADIGHYESEQFTKNRIVAHLTKKITNFAVVLSKTNTNPVQYF